jgi:DNA-directed RNA polymerase subunit RPC12/RpoP
MKIDFKCTNCSSVLRLPAEHIGKHARCPVCQTVVLVEPGKTTNVPTESALKPLTNSDSIDDLFSAVESKPTEAPGSVGQFPNLPVNPTDFSRPINESPYASPQYGGMPNVNYQPSSSPDGFWITGVVLGSISLILSCGCGCYGSIPALFLSSVGLVLTFASKSPNKIVGYLLNGIAFGFGFLILMILLVFGTIAAMN